MEPSREFTGKAFLSVACRHSKFSNSDFSASNHAGAFKNSERLTSYRLEFENSGHCGFGWKVMHLDRFDSVRSSSQPDRYRTHKSICGFQVVNAVGRRAKELKNRNQFGCNRPCCIEFFATLAPSLNTCNYESKNDCGYGTNGLHPSCCSLMRFNPLKKACHA